jgi:hypothetical protein
MDEGIAVDAAVASEFRLLQPGDHPEYPPLFRPGQLRLETHHVEQGHRPVLRTKLDDRIGPAAGPGIDETNGLHRAENQCKDSASGNDFHGQAAFEAFCRLERPERDVFPFRQGLPETLVGLLFERAVQIIPFAAVIPRCPENLI